MTVLIKSHHFVKLVFRSIPFLCIHQESKGTGKKKLLGFAHSFNDVYIVFEYPVMIHNIAI